MTSTLFTCLCGRSFFVHARSAPKSAECPSCGEQAKPSTAPAPLPPPVHRPVAASKPVSDLSEIGEKIRQIVCDEVEDFSITERRPNKLSLEIIVDTPGHSLSGTAKDLIAAARSQYRERATHLVKIVYCK